MSFRALLRLWEDINNTPSGTSWTLYGSLLFLQAAQVVGAAIAATHSSSPCPSTDAVCGLASAFADLGSPDLRGANEVTHELVDQVLNLFVSYLGVIAILLFLTKVALAV